MSYVIAAYGVVLVSLVWYGWRVRRQSRLLSEQRPGAARAERDR